MTLYAIQCRVDFPFTLPNHPGWSELRGGSINSIHPIEYLSDIAEAEHLIEQAFYNEWISSEPRFIGNPPPRLKISLLDWHELKGEQRPD